jgi:hypothetical protein
MTSDWQYLVDTLKITSHDGLPVVGIFGFYPSRGLMYGACGR